jgi:hypothetical protein
MAHQASNGKNGPATGMQKTPAPDSISHLRSPSGATYGEGGGVNNPSVVEPGKRVMSGLAANMADSVADDVLPDVVRYGTAKNARVTSQLRKIASGNVPTHPGTSGASKGGTVPATIGASRAPVIKNPTR